MPTASLRGTATYPVGDFDALERRGRAFADNAIRLEKQAAASRDPQEARKFLCRAGEDYIFAVECYQDALKCQRAASQRHAVRKILLGILGRAEHVKARLDTDASLHVMRNSPEGQTQQHSQMPQARVIKGLASAAGLNLPSPPAVSPSAGLSPTIQAGRGLPQRTSPTTSERPLLQTSASAGMGHPHARQGAQSPATVTKAAMEHLCSQRELQKPSQQLSVTDKNRSQGLDALRSLAHPVSVVDLRTPVQSRSWQSPSLTIDATKSLPTENSCPDPVSPISPLHLSRSMYAETPLSNMAAEGKRDWPVDHRHHSLSSARIEPFPSESSTQSVHATPRIETVTENRVSTSQGHEHRFEEEIEIYTETQRIIQRQIRRQPDAGQQSHQVVELPRRVDGLESRNNLNHVSLQPNSHSNIENDTRLVHGSQGGRTGAPDELSMRPSQILSEELSAKDSFRESKQNGLTPNLSRAKQDDVSRNSLRRQLDSPNTSAAGKTDESSVNIANASSDFPVPPSPSMRSSFFVSRPNRAPSDSSSTSAVVSENGTSVEDKVVLQRGLDEVAPMSPSTSRIRVSPGERSEPGTSDYPDTLKDTRRRNVREVDRGPSLSDREVASAKVVRREHEVCRNTDCPVMFSSGDATSFSNGNRQQASMSSAAAESCSLVIADNKDTDYVAREEATKNTRVVHGKADSAIEDEACHHLNSSDVDRRRLSLKTASTVERDCNGQILQKLSEIVEKARSLADEGLSKDRRACSSNDCLQLLSEALHDYRQVIGCIQLAIALNDDPESERKALERMDAFKDRICTINDWFDKYVDGAVTPSSRNIRRATSTADGNEAATVFLEMLHNEKDENSSDLEYEIEDLMKETCDILSAEH